MTMTTQVRATGACICVLSLLPTLAGCGVGYSSPEAVASAAKMAIDNKDMAAFYDCLTEESQDTLAGTAVMVGAMMKMMSGMAAMGGAEAAAKAEQATTEVAAVMDKHGVTEDDLKNAGANPMMMTDSKAIASLAGVVTDKRAFVDDMFTVFNKASNGGPDLGEKFTGELKDLKITGDRATAKLATARGDQELDFHNTATGWKLHIDMEKMAANAGPSPIGSPADGPANPFGASPAEGPAN
jgi:hypothetical protein